jgi:hypothetical protein
MRSFSARLLAIVAGTWLLACGPPRTTSAPRSPANAPLPDDAGLPPPPPSARRGVIVPSDTGLGAQPPGSAPATGTSGGSVGPTLGNGSGSGN